MSASLAVCLLAAGQVASPSANPPTPANQRVAVTELEAGFGADAKLTHTLSGLLVAELRRRPGLRVTSQEDLRSLLSLERQKQMLNCSDAGCLAEIGGALGAAEMVTGSFSRVGETDVLSLRRIDVKRARVLSTATSRLRASSQEALLDLIGQLVEKLYPDLATTAPLDATGLFEVDQAPQRPSVVPPLILGLSGLAVAGVGLGLLVDALSVSQTGDLYGLSYPAAQRKNGEGTAGVALVSVGGAVALAGLIWGLAR